MSSTLKKVVGVLVATGVVAIGISSATRPVYQGAALGGDKLESGVSPLVQITRNIAGGYIQKPGHAKCSGAVISSTNALTAAHCFDFNSDGQVYADEVFAEDIKHVLKVPVTKITLSETQDMALLEGDFSQFISAATATDIPSAGSTLLFYGFPLGYPEPIGSLVQTIGPAMNLVRVHGYAYSGMSGGPVINLMTGAVVGVITAHDPSGFAYFTPILDIQTEFGDTE